jgi:hypothetical protein
MRFFFLISENKNQVFKAQDTFKKEFRRSKNVGAGCGESNPDSYFKFQLTAALNAAVQHGPHPLPTLSPSSR